MTVYHRRPEPLGEDVRRSWWDYDRPPRLDRLWLACAAVRCLLIVGLVVWLASIAAQPALVNLGR